MSILRDRVVLNCFECGTELDSMDPIPPRARHFVNCDCCEMGGVPLGYGDYEMCTVCDGHGELVFCTKCYEKYVLGEGGAAAGSEA